MSPAEIDALSSRLRARREEIEEATLARLGSIGAPPGRPSLEYGEGLREAVGAAVEQAIATIERVDDVEMAVPLPLVLQARLAARSGVGLDTVARRYVAAHGVISEFVHQEASGNLSSSELTRVLGVLRLAVDRLLLAASEAYNREASARGQDRDRARLEHVERLLSGELLDAEGLGYDLGLNHLGVVAAGPEIGQVVTMLADAIDARLLTVNPSSEVCWAWFGAREPLDPAEVRGAAEVFLPGPSRLAVGEAGRGLPGWRLTHRQACAGFEVARRGTEGRGVVRYSEVAVLATVLHDELLERTLRHLYLDPLRAERERGAILLETLKAYFSVDCNVTSAAAVLDLNRNTVSARLREAEALLGRPLHRCRTELDIALRLSGARD